METRLIKEDKLAGIIGKMSQDMPVFAPVKEEDNVLFKQLEKGQTPLIRFANSKNAPKNFFFPHSEQMMKYTRTENGMAFAGAAEAAKESVLFGVRPCDAHSYLLLDMLFDQEKYRDPFYIDKREKTIVITLACAHPPYTTCFCTSVDGSPTAADGADILLTDIGDELSGRVHHAQRRETAEIFCRRPQGGRPGAGGEKGRCRKGRSGDQIPHSGKGHQAHPGRELRASLLEHDSSEVPGLRDLHLSVPDLPLLRHQRRGQRQRRDSPEKLGLLHVSPVHEGNLRSQSPVQPEGTVASAGDA